MMDGNLEMGTITRVTKPSAPALFVMLADVLKDNVLFFCANIKLQQLYKLKKLMLLIEMRTTCMLRSYGHK